MLRQRILERTRELAVRACRSTLDVTQRDYERAKLELTGESDPERQETIIDSVSSPVAVFVTLRSA